MTDTIQKIADDMLVMAEHIQASSPQHKERRLREWADRLRTLSARASADDNGVAYLNAIDEGPDGEDGPWAEGWEERSRPVADPFTAPQPAQTDEVEGADMREFERRNAAFVNALPRKIDGSNSQPAQAGASGGEVPGMVSANALYKLAGHWRLFGTPEHDYCAAAASALAIAASPATGQGEPAAWMDHLGGVITAAMKKRDPGRPYDIPLYPPQPATGATVEGLRQGNWQHPDGGRIVGWVIEPGDVERMKADAFCLPREVAEALETLRAAHATPQPAAAQGGEWEVEAAGTDAHPQWWLHRNGSAFFNFGYGENAELLAKSMARALTRLAAAPQPQAVDCGEAGHKEGRCGNAQCLESATPPAHGEAGFALLRELRTARPLVLYGDEWIKRIDSVLALANREAQGEGPQEKTDG